MRVFFSHSFSDELQTTIEAFRQILGTVKERIEAEARDKNSQQTVEIEEGDKADYPDPVNSIFPKIRDCDVLFCVLCRECDGTTLTSFASPACLQEIVVAQQSGKKIMVWVEDGTRKLGFTDKLTTYRTFDTNALILEDRRQKIHDNIRDALLSECQPSLSTTDNYLYFNSFGEGSPCNVRTYKWYRRALRHDERGKPITDNRGQPLRVQEEVQRNGGQHEIPFLPGDTGPGVLVVANTDECWNWSANHGQSIAHLAAFDPKDFAIGTWVNFEVRCRSTGIVQVMPLLNGPVVDPQDKENKEKWCWPLTQGGNPDPKHPWNFQEIRAEEGWVSRMFVGRIDYPPDKEYLDKATLFLISKTQNNLLVVDKVMFGLRRTGGETE